MGANRKPPSANPGLHMFYSYMPCRCIVWSWCKPTSCKPDYISVARQLMRTRGTRCFLPSGEPWFSCRLVRPSRVVARFFVFYWTLLVSVLCRPVWCCYDDDKARVRASSKRIINRSKPTRSTVSMNLNRGLILTRSSNTYMSLSGRLFFL